MQSLSKALCYFRFIRIDKNRLDIAANRAVIDYNLGDIL